MALSNQIDFPAIFSLRKMTYRNFINSGIRHSAIGFDPVRWPYAVMFRKLTFRNLQTAESQCKCHREHSGLLKRSPERHFNQTKPAYQSLSRCKWFYAPFVMVSL
jgi:hypothetical protein